jgi:hypothetical protein
VQQRARIVSALGKLLDDLDAARAKATPGDWAVAFDEWSEGAAVETDDERITPEIGTADAFLIARMHLALPRLTAALRAVEALADSYPLGTDVPVYRLRRILDGTGEQEAPR